MKSLIRLLGFHPDCTPKTSDWLAALGCVLALVSLCPLFKIIILLTAN